MKKIDALSVFVSVDPENGDEGVVAMLTTEGWLPMVAADQDRVDMLRPHAQNIAREKKIPIKLVRFSHHEVVEEFKP